MDDVRHVALTDMRNQCNHLLSGLSLAVNFECEEQDVYFQGAAVKNKPKGWVVNSDLYFLMIF